MKTLKSLVCVLLAATAVGCRPTSTFSTVVLPNTQNGVVLVCSYRAECFRLAALGCHGAYTILEGEDNIPHLPQEDADGPTGTLQPTNDFNPARRGTEYVIACNSHHGDGS